MLLSQSRHDLVEYTRISYSKKN